MFKIVSNQDDEIGSHVIEASRHHHTHFLSLMRHFHALHRVPLSNHRPLPPVFYTTKRYSLATSDIVPGS